MIQTTVHGVASCSGHKVVQTLGCRNRVFYVRPPSGLASPRSSRRRQTVLQAAAGDGGSISGGGDIGGKGPRYRTSPADNDEPQDNRWFRWKGWEDRVAYDPEFPFKVFLEQVIGVGAAVIGDMSSRPNWGLYELDFVFSTLVVGSIMNFSLMYLLAPTAAAAAVGAGGGGILQRLLSEEFLRKWGAPGGNMFEPGFPLHKRLVNFGYKGLVFASIGLMAGIIGTATSNGLLALRKKLDPEFETQNKPPHILFNAVTWSLHMGISSNLRYQILGGTDQILVKLMPSTMFRVYSTGVRTANNIVGGISFVTLARILGVQKAAAA